MRQGMLIAGWRLAILVTVLTWTAIGQAQLPDPIQTRVFKDETGDHRYALFVPRNYSADRKWPVLMFLHGAGERGNDGNLQVNVGIGPVLRKRAANFPFIVVMPQCEDTQSRYLSGWLQDTPDAQRALKILASVEKEFSIDPEKRVLSGWSMGGFGTWSIASANPKMWSAIVPLAGGGDPALAKTLTEVPIWAFHGSNDTAIRPDQSRAMISAIRVAGGTPRLTEVTDGEHDINQIVFDNDVLIGWMLNPKTTEPTSLVLRAVPTLGATSREAFIPAAELSNAITLRLGNETLDAISVSLHQMIPREALSGWINDIYDSTSVDGRQFSITFGSISYAGNVSRVRLNAYRQDRLNVAVAISNAVLRIGGTSVVGRSHSASTGPIDIVIGHRAPVWLSVDVTPYIENGKLRLKVAGASFNIPWDNWYVTAPAGVSVNGFGMTRERVSQGLVDGLYGNKARIENEVMAAVPRLVAELERKLELVDADQIVGAIWPLPVYKPRIRVRAEDISVDDKGVSIVLGTVVAAIDPNKPVKSIVRQRVTNTTAGAINKSTVLSLGIAPQMLGELSRMLVESGVAHIHVLDIPEPSFARFVDREVMTKAFPELKRYGEDLQLRAELSLEQAMSIQNGNSEGELKFQLPELKIAIAYKPNKETPKFLPFADLKIALVQGAVPKLHRPDFESRMFQLNWTGDADIKVTPTFAESYKAENTEIDNEHLTELMQTSWKGWAGHGAASQTPIPDLEFGIAKMRLDEVSWKSPFLGVSFAPPGVKLTNSAKEALVYETKGPFSDWGGPYTLEPGKSHELPISYPLTYRQRSGDQVFVYTLAPGSHSEYRVPQIGGKPQLFKAREELATKPPEQTAAPQQ